MAENTLLISKVEYDTTSVRPILCDFQNGKIPEGFEDHMMSQVYKDADNQLLVAVAANKQLYTKKIVPNKTHNTFIAIPNSKGTKVRLVAVDYAKLAPHTEDDDEKNTAGISLKTDLDFTDKRSKRRVNEKSKLKADIESIKDHLAEAAAGVNIDEIDLNSSISQNTYRPTINTEAESIEEVYPLHDLVPENVLESLTPEAERIFSDFEEDMGTCEFVTDILSKFDNINSNKKRRSCQVWLYIDCLIKFMQSTMKVVTTKKYKACSYSDLANDDILQKFTALGPTGRHRPSIMKDKCTCYLLVLCTINSNYTFDVTALATHINVSANRLIDFAKILRFTTKGKMVTLKLPLPIVVESKSRKKKSQIH